MTTAPLSFRAAARRGLSRACVWSGGLAVGFLAVHWLTGGVGSMTMVEPAPPTEQHIVSVFEARVDHLEQSGQCWSGPAPRDVAYPGSVLLDQIVRGERRAVRVGTDHIVDRALTQVLGGPDAGLNVIAFCR